MMRSHKVFAAVGISAAFAAAGLGIAACSSSTTPSSASSGSASSGSGGGPCTNSLQIVFNPMFSAFEPSHKYQLVAAVNVPDNVTWTASDSMAVGFEPNADLTGGGYTGTTITVLKAGDVTITAQSGNLCGSAPLHVTAAQSSDWDIGNARYNNGMSLHLPNFAEGGAPTFRTDAGSFFETPGTPPPACTNCHGPTATANMFTDVSHTPEQTAGFSDQDLLSIILNGTVPDGGYFDPNIVSMRLWHGIHQWQDITPDQQTGIIVYLRSLTPAKQTGNVNLGNFLNRDGGMPGGGGGMDAGAAGD